jgi:hypothetical protein
LLEKVVENGKRVSERRDLNEIRAYTLDCVAKMPERIRQVIVNKPYEMKISNGLNDLVEELTEKYSKKEQRDER